MLADGPRAEAGMTAGVRTAFQLFLQEAQGLLWQILLVASGLSLEAATGAERLVVDVAGALEDGRLQTGSSLAGHWSRRMIGAVRSRLVRATRQCAPEAHAGVRLAARADAALLKRRGLDGPRDGTDRR
jgi:hypothetical protein